jgi:hypothetical protein
LVLGSQQTNNKGVLTPDSIINNINPGLLTVLTNTDKGQKKLSFCPKSINEFIYTEDKTEGIQTLKIVKNDNLTPIILRFTNFVDKDFAQHQNKLRIMLFHTKVILSLLERNESWKKTFNSLINNYFEVEATENQKFNYVNNLGVLKYYSSIKGVSKETYNPHLNSLTKTIINAIKAEKHFVDYRVVRLDLIECNYLEERKSDVIILS